MKHTYEKPVITISPDLSEGVYAASGKQLSLSGRTVIDRWNGGGSLLYTLNMAGQDPSQLSVTITCNAELSDGWGDGASKSVSGNSVTLTWYSAPESATIHVQTRSMDVDQFEAVSVSASNN